jgi:hypothetical protein
MGAVKRSPRFRLQSIVLHVLASALVMFAVQAKLALYKPSPEPGIAAAKLSTEKNSSKVFSAIGKLKQTKAPADFSIVALRNLANCDGARAALHVHSASIDLLASARLHHQGIARFHRPPPTLL